MLCCFACCNEVKAKSQTSQCSTFGPTGPLFIYITMEMEFQLISIQFRNEKLSIEY